MKKPVGKLGNLFFSFQKMQIHSITLFRVKYCMHYKREDLNIVVLSKMSVRLYVLSITASLPFYQYFFFHSNEKGNQRKSKKMF